VSNAETGLRYTTLNSIEIGRFVVTFVVTRPVFGLIPEAFTYENRRGRESNPRIAVLQTATLPLGYPAGIERTQNILVSSGSVNAQSESEGVLNWWSNGIE
jgi:hypothetical protein